MAIDMFVKIDGIKGESQDDKHKDEIDILSWNFGMTQPGSAHTGGGGGAGKVMFNDISISKYTDASSHALMLACAEGEHIKEVKLFVRKAGQKPLEYVVLSIRDVLVTSISTGGPGADDRCIESVTFNYDEIEFGYTKQAKTGGADGAPLEFKWSVEKNVKL